MQTIDELIQGQGDPPFVNRWAEDDELWDDIWNPELQIDDRRIGPSPGFPPDPEFVQLDWGPLPTKHEYKFAHALWSTPNSMLDAPIDAPYPNERTDNTEFLTKNIYAHLETRGFDFPLTEDGWNPQAQFRFENGSPALWTYEELGPNAPERRRAGAHDIVIAGKGNKPHLWTVLLLRDELRARGLSDRAKKEKWLKQRMIEELFAYEQRQLFVEDRLYLRQSLDRWGIERRAQDIAACQDQKGRLSPLHLYTWALHLSPYNPTYWISRAYLYYQQGYFDLAIGDTFRALYLVNMLMNKNKTSNASGLYIRVWDAIEQHIIANWEADAQGDADEVYVNLKAANGLIQYIPHLRRTAYHILSLSLLGLHAWYDWTRVEKSVTQDMRQPRRYAEPFDRRWRTLQGHALERIQSRVDENERWRYELIAGNVCGRSFPQSAGDVHRITKAFCARLNEEFFRLQPIEANDARNVEVREKENGELGVFALRAFHQGENIYTEKPSARGILKRLDFFDSRNAPQPLYCENCKRSIEMDARFIDVNGNRYFKPELRQAADQGHSSICNCIAMEPDLHWCGVPDDTKVTHENEGAASANTPNALKRKAPINDEVEILATRRSTRTASRSLRALRGPKKSLKTRSQKLPSSEPPRSPEFAPKREPDTVKTCLEKAREQYHFQACGADWSWLHRGMQHIGDRATDNENLRERDNYEEHGTLLSLLLREIFDMTLLKRKNATDSRILAHEIDAMLPLCGAENSPGRHFPFGYSANIVMPFNILLKLGVNIFKKSEFDTWVIQTVLRKLLMNCVPWDRELRGGRRMRPRSKPTKPGKEAPPAFENLYLHTGFAMFNHACKTAANAEWFWDDWTAGQAQNSEATPTRIIVRARQAIAPDDEIKIQYYPGKASSDDQIRQFGRLCDCGHCRPVESSG